jgi:hypothetical protein
MAGLLVEKNYVKAYPPTAGFYLLLLRKNMKETLKNNFSTEEKIIGALIVALAAGGIALTFKVGADADQRLDQMCGDDRSKCVRIDDYAIVGLFDSPSIVRSSRYELKTEIPKK